MAAAASPIHRRLAVIAAATLVAASTLTLVVRAQPAPAGAPASQPTTQQSPYDRLLGNVETGGAERPIQPVGPGTMVDQTTGANAVAEGAPRLTTRREGTFLPRVVGDPPGRRTMITIEPRRPARCSPARSCSIASTASTTSALRK